MGIRSIEFRGKRVDNGEWVEGYYVCDTIEKSTCHYIFPENTCEGVEVIHETIGQYTGLNAKGKKIFEGDVVVVTDAYGNKATYIVEYRPTAFCVSQLGVNHSTYLGDFDSGKYEIEVIGNIYDNPELLGGDSENESEG